MFGMKENKSAKVMPCNSVLAVVVIRLLGENATSDTDEDQELMFGEKL